MTTLFFEGHRYAAQLAQLDSSDLDPGLRLVAIPIYTGDFSDAYMDEYGMVYPHLFDTVTLEQVEPGVWKAEP